MYGKIFMSTFTGSMLGAGSDVFAVWAFVIANTVNSKVELNPAYLAMVIGTEAEKVSEAIAYLCSPDPESRSAEMEGRRLVKDGKHQYRVVNHEQYRSIRNEDDRREYNTRKQRESRARKIPVSNGMSLTVIDSQHMSALSAHTEAQAEAEAEGTTREPSPMVHKTVRKKKPEHLAGESLPEILCGKESDAWRDFWTLSGVWPEKSNIRKKDSARAYVEARKSASHECIQAWAEWTLQETEGKITTLANWLSNQDWEGRQQKRDGLIKDSASPSVT